MSVRPPRLGLALAAALITTAVSPARAAEPPASWDEAERRELQALERERTALADALARADADAKVAARGLESEITGLARELAEVEADNATLEATLPARERARADDVQDAALVQLMQGMQTWLRTQGVTAADATQPASLPTLVDLALREADRRGGMYLERGASYFDRDGARASGDVLRIGQVAALLLGEPPLPLVETPDGLQVVTTVQPLRERAGEGDRVRVWLADPSHTGAPAWLGDPTLLATFAAGGPLMWGLLALALVGLAVAVERTWVLARAALQWRRWRARAPHATTAAPWIAAPVATVTAAGTHAQARTGEALEAALDRAARAATEVERRLLRGTSAIATVAAAAPLTGLLGTVTGMIETFSVVTDVGASDPQRMAGGIGEALITTQFGLMIAIPCLLAHAALVRGARRLLGAVEAAALERLDTTAPASPQTEDDRVGGD